MGTGEFISTSSHSIDSTLDMATHLDPEIDKKVAVTEDHGVVAPQYEDAVVEEEKTYAYDDSRKLGITGSVFLILNKMIGTGSMFIDL